MKAFELLTIFLYIMYTGIYVYVCVCTYSQNEGKMKYIEQQEIFARECKKEEDPSIKVCHDCYEETFRDKHFDVSEGHEHVAQELREAELSQSAIETILRCRSEGLLGLMGKMEDVVSSQEEAEEMAEKNRQWLGQVDWSKVFKDNKGIYI